MNEVTAEPMTLAEQVEYWMDRYFKLHDEYAALLNQLAEIERVLGSRQL